ncbi:MAG: hypothetical protein ACJ76H_01390 [Bacteriovoracaceae bacterium]
MNKMNLLPVFALAGTLVSSSAFSAHIREFQTTRLNSTAGAGVASILSTEAAILNPATAAFFAGNSASYQGYKTSLQHKNTVRDVNNDPFAKQNRSQGVFVSDSSGDLKGGVAYTSQKENHYERTRSIIHGASAMGSKSSMGVSYNYIQDTLPTNAKDRHQTQHQATIGLIHVLDEDMSVGAIIVDPTRTTPGEQRFIAGFQYQVAVRFVLIGDVGIDYTGNVNEDYLWRGALQIKLFDDFYIRGGYFNDNITKSKGNGWGAGWIGPRFGVEFAQKLSEYSSTSYLYKDERIVDTSLSAIIKF